VSDCCLTPFENVFSLYHGENQLPFDKMRLMSVLY